METVINISSFVPCTMLGTFYSGAGTLDEEKLKAFLGSNFESVVGWYRCRGSSCEDLYLRETLLHRQLATTFSHTGGHFLLALLCRAPPSDPGTITLSHKFMMLQNECLAGVALEVTNMGDTSVTDYLLKPHSPALYTSAAVNNVIAQIKNFEPGVEEAEALHSGLLKKLGLLLPHLSAAQQELHHALKEVTALRHLCHVNNISPDFVPSPCQKEPDQNLMDFEEVPGSSGTAGSQRRKASEPAKLVRSAGSARARGGGSNKERNKPGTDPFGFVNKEMEKLQVRNSSNSPVGSISRVGRSRSNTPSPGRVLNKPTTGGLRDTANRGSIDSPSASQKLSGRRSKENSPAPLGCVRDSPERVTKGKLKTGRVLSRTPSRDTNSPSRNTRGRSPSIGSTVGTKTTKPITREAWSEKTVSDSQEF